MKVILKKEGTQIKRSYAPDEQATDSSWQNFKELLKDKHKKLLPAQYQNQLNQILRLKEEKVFFEPVDVPWYFDEVGRFVIETNQKCELQVKACGLFHFIQLIVPGHGLKGKPYFHKLEAPKASASPEDPKQVRGAGDLFLFLSTHLVKAVTADQMKALLEWFHLELVITPVKSKKKAPSDEVTILVEPKVVWPDNLIPGEWENPTDPDKYFIKYSTTRTRRLYKASDNHPKSETKDEILVVSSNVQDAVSRIAEVWHNPTVGSVLLSAWTGSGKEPLQNLFMHGMEQPPSMPKFSAPSLAQEASPEQRIIESLKSVKNLTVPPQKSSGGMTTNGKLNKRSVIFIDEVHHPSARSLRESLLRVMETSRFEAADGSYDCKGMLTFLFAASKPPELLRKEDPPDFWTRIEHTIRMAHPLREKHRGALKLVLRQYFLLFWRDALHEVEKEQREVLMQKECVSEVGEAFVQLFGSLFIPIISVRMMRSIVKRLANRAAYCIKTEYFGTSTTGADLYVAIGKEFDEWTKDLFEEIVPTLQPEGAF